jgi:hypothetical protein
MTLLKRFIKRTEMGNRFKQAVLVFLVPILIAALVPIVLSAINFSNLETLMINLIILTISGVLGGHAAAAGLKDEVLGTVGVTSTGSIGGLVGGTSLQAVIPALSAASGNMDIGSLLGQMVSGGVGGAALTAIMVVARAGRKI